MNKIEKIRTRIIDVAQTAFYKLGVDKTTMELIAKRAGKSKSTLYYYFKDKNELYAAVIEREGNFMMTELAKIINREDSTDKILELYAKRRFELAETVLSNYKLEGNNYEKVFPIIQKYRKKHDEFEYFAIKQILVKGIEKDELNITLEHINDVALGISAAIKGLEIPLLIESSKNTIEKKIEIMLNLLLYGLLKKNIKKVN